MDLAFIIQTIVWCVLCLIIGFLIGKSETELRMAKDVNRVLESMSNKLRESMDKKEKGKKKDK